MTEPFAELAREALKKHVNVLWATCGGCEQCVEYLAAGIARELAPRLSQAARQIAEMQFQWFDDEPSKVYEENVLQILHSTLGQPGGRRK